MLIFDDIGIHRFFLYLQRLVNHLPDLKEIEIEECTMVQGQGIKALGRKCAKLQKTNLNGMRGLESLNSVLFRIVIYPSNNLQPWVHVHVINVQYVLSISLRCLISHFSYVSS